jgi:dCMP deaminase
MVSGKAQYEWDAYLLGIAEAASKKSKDPKTKVGAAIVAGTVVVSTGFNGFPRGVDEAPERWERPTKYRFVAHAEANAICNAAREGINTTGCTLYLHGFPGPCIDCAKLIIQAGIGRVVWKPGWYSDPQEREDSDSARVQWKEDLDFAVALLEEGDVLISILPLRWPDYPAIV